MSGGIGPISSPPWTPFNTRLLRLLNATYLWPLGEPNGATRASEVLGGKHAALTTAPTFGETGVVAAETDTSALFTAASSQYLTTASLDDPGGYDVTLIAFLKTSAADLRVFFSANGDNVWLGSQGTAKFTAGGKTAIGASINDGNWHMVAGVWVSGGNVTCNVDGVDGTPQTGSAAHGPANIQGTATIGRHSGGYYWSGWGTKFIIVRRGMLAPELLSLWQAARQP